MNLFARFVPRTSPSRRLTGVGLSLLLASSCAMPPFGRTATRNDPPEATHAHFSSEDEGAGGMSAVAQSPEGPTSAGVIQQLSHEEPAAATGEVTEWPALPADPTNPFAAPTRNVQYSIGDEAAGLCPTPRCHPNDARIGLPTESLSLQNCPMPWEQTCEVPVPVCEPEIWADEYLCDGGDRDEPVHYHGTEISGLETEDTVAEFTDHTGEEHVRPSTRVCIYAPQFASVRSSSGSHIGEQIDRAVGAHDNVSTFGLNAQRLAMVEEQTDQPIGIDVRSRVSGLDTDMATSSLDQIASLVNHVKLVNLFEDRAFFERVELDQTEELYLAYGIQSAVVWASDVNPVIIAVDVAGQEVIAEFKVEEYVGVEEKPPGDLKIVKLADKHVARPGEVVTFTIHYDNVGQRELTKVRIIDNLTPRLEYIAESGDSDRDGRLNVEDNGEGSHVLTFELAEPLPGESGGTLTFQARVR